MIKILRKTVVTLAFGALSTIMATNAYADEWPMIGGDYWEVTGIDIKDGGDWKYVNWIATEWRKSAEFSKSKGWIKDFMILGNVHGRKGEPDLYIIRVREDMPSGAVGEKRNKEYADWVKKTEEQMVDESGNRAEYREVTSTTLLQHYKFRN